MLTIREGEGTTVIRKHGGRSDDSLSRKRLFILCTGIMTGVSLRCVFNEPAHDLINIALTGSRILVSMHGHGVRRSLMSRLVHSQRTLATFASLHPNPASVAKLSQTRRFFWRLITGRLAPALRYRLRIYAYLCCLLRLWIVNPIASAPS
jgi:hypothetical protein